MSIKQHPISDIQSLITHFQLPISKIDWEATASEAAQLLSRYLQFDTTNPPGNEAPAIEFLAGVLRERGFTPQIIESAPGRANLIVRLPASPQAAAPPCLLYSHADVVPAEAADWSVPPFGGIIQDGFVWGRGALDNKGSGIIFLQALSLLKQQAISLSRDIILLVAADEEVAGDYGVAWLLKHHPHLIEAEYVWDEGGIGRRLPDRNIYYVALAEKVPLTIKLVAQGTPGHASIPSNRNPHHRLIQALTRVTRWESPVRLTDTVIQLLQALAPYQPFPQSLLFKYADKSLYWPLLRHWLDYNPFFLPLICNSINVTMLQGGQAGNVIPARSEALLDVRLLPDEEPQAFLAALRSIISDSNISVDVEAMPPGQSPTPADTPFYNALAQTIRTLDPQAQVVPYLTPGATDSRFFRAAGMKAYGFMPVLVTDRELSRIHGIDERISIDNLRRGIQLVFETLLKL